MRLFRMQAYEQQSSPPNLLSGSLVLRASFAWKISKKENTLILCENNVDDVVIPESFEYIKESVYAADIPPTSLQPVTCCECLECSDDSDCCPTKASVAFAYRLDVPDRLIDPLSKQAIYECTSLCQCPLTCPNRVIQRGITLPLVLFKTENRGWGLKTMGNISGGAFVAEYVGEVMSSLQSQHLLDERYVFNLDFNLDKKANFVIDSSAKGNLSRFINSRCGDCNLVPRAIYVDCVVPELPRIGLFAVRDIAANEELTLDYFQALDRYCLCGSIFCRKKQTPSSPSCIEIISSPEASSSDLQKEAAIAQATAEAGQLLSELTVEKLVVKREKMMPLTKMEPNDSSDDDVILTGVDFGPNYTIVVSSDGDDDS